MSRTRSVSDAAAPRNSAGFALRTPLSGLGADPAGGGFRPESQPHSWHSRYRLRLCYEMGVLRHQAWDGWQETWVEFMRYEAPETVSAAVGLLKKAKEIGRAHV